MKKFMLAAAVTCAAMLTQAASLNWSTPYVLDADLNAVDTGTYFLVALNSNTTAGIGIDATGAVVDANGAIKSTYSSGTFSSADTLAGKYTSDSLTQSSNGTYVALIVVHATDYTQFGISDILTISGIVDATVDTQPIDAADLTFSNYEDDLGLAMQIVPEPTVLALLALGVAGLALKRKNA